MTRKINQDLSATEFGKLPPQSRELEEAVLGATMMEEMAIHHIIGFLKPEDFYVEAHRMIFAAITALYAAQAPIDMLTVREQLMKDGTLEQVGGAYYVAQLSNKIGTAGNIEYHARIILQKSMARRVITTGTEYTRLAYEQSTDVIEMIEDFQRAAMDITPSGGREAQRIGTIMVPELHQIATAPKIEIIGLPTPFTEMNETLLGWEPGMLYILAARPGMGKTAWMLKAAEKVALLQKPIAIFSMEMPSIQLIQRLISMSSGVPHEKIRKRDLSNVERLKIATATAELRDSRIYIDDTPALTIFEMMSKLRKMKQRFGIEMVIIDYLQLMKGGSELKSNANREQEISAISGALKACAKELSLPVIALAQLNRDLEKRPNKRPVLSDLRDGGSIEQDADAVIFLYRPEYYELTVNAQGQSTKGLCENIIAKNRHGKIKTINSLFKEQTMDFSDWI